MKKPLIFLFAAAVAPALVANPSSAIKMAPDFTLADQTGKSHSLSDFRGRFVVLEWWNHQCPFVVKHYASGNMQKLQKQMTDDKVVWLTINSSAPGKQGHVSGEQAKALMKELGKKATAVLLDHDGKVGRAFEAKTTPQMVLISPKGELLYNGAIDSIRSASQDDVPKAENFLLRAYNEAKAGKPVSMPTTQPYGCSVKY
ncbi:MAG: redoxin family protein [Fimbriimonadaceae bacterium]|nr:redoxin family protein [Fimbriimonadaceae bacterium]